MRNLIVIAAVLFLIGCKSAFEETLASRDVQKKENLAFELYEKKEYYKAGELFKSLIQDKKSGEAIEKMFFYYALCDYELEDFGLAAYEFERLIQKFPRGKFNEQSQYYIAMANYEKSPPHFLDQDYTYRAIESFQLFLDKYPLSSKREEVNTKVDELTDKLEYKMYKQAKLFYHMEEYKSASIALEGVVSEYPDSKHAEEIYFLVAESNFRLAKKSVEYKQIDRFNKAIKTSGEFKKKFKESEYADRVMTILDRSKAEIVRLKLELPEYYQKIGDYNKSIDLYETLFRRAKNLGVQQNIALKLFAVHHAKSQKSSTQTKLKSYEELMNYYNGLTEPNRTFVDSKISKEVESAMLGYQLYKLDVAYQLYKEGKYFFSLVEYKKLLSDTSIAHKPKDWYFYLKSNYQYAISQEAKLKKSQLDTILINTNLAEFKLSQLNSSYLNKINKIRRQVEKDLKDYPVLLVKEPYRNGDYKVSLSRAQNLLKNNLDKKDEEEIVYLLIASAVKHAKKGKRFERQGRFVDANKLLLYNLEKIEDEEFLVKVDKLKGKIEKGINKYKLKER